MAVGVLVGVTFAVPAQARTIDQGVDPIDFSYVNTDCGYHVSGHVVGTESYVDKLHGGDAAGFDFLGPWYTFTITNSIETVTNDDTGISFQAVRKNDSSRDQKVLSIQGSVMTILRVGTSHFTVYRPDGRPYYKRDGRFQYEYTYDTLGTPDPADDTDAFVEGSFRFNGGDPGVDFCADVIALTTS